MWWRYNRGWLNRRRCQMYVVWWSRRWRMRWHNISCLFKGLYNKLHHYNLQIKFTFNIFFACLNYFKRKFLIVNHITLKFTTRLYFACLKDLMINFVTKINTKLKFTCLNISCLFKGLYNKLHNYKLQFKFTFNIFLNESIQAPDKVRNLFYS